MNAQTNPRRALRPDLGALPAYSSTATSSPIDGLDLIDAQVLKLAGDEAVRDVGELFDTREFVDSTMAALEITEDQCIESLEVLDADGYVELHRTFGRGLESMARFTLTTLGLDRYAATFVTDYADMQHRVVGQLIAGPEQGTDEEIAARADVPRLLVLHILTLLEGNGLLTLSKSYGPVTHYFNPSPKLRRLVQ